jgi:hypothetical protein
MLGNGEPAGPRGSPPPILPVGDLIAELEGTRTSLFDAPVSMAIRSLANWPRKRSASASNASPISSRASAANCSCTPLATPTPRSPPSPTAPTPPSTAASSKAAAASSTADPGGANPSARVSRRNDRPIDHLQRPHTRRMHPPAGVSSAATSKRSRRGLDTAIRAAYVLVRRRDPQRTTPRPLPRLRRRRVRACLLEPRRAAHPPRPLLQATGGSCGYRSRRSVARAPRTRFLRAVERR